MPKTQASRHVPYTYMRKIDVTTVTSTSDCVQLEVVTKQDCRLNGKQRSMLLQKGFVLCKKDNVYVKLTVTRAAALKNLLSINVLSLDYENNTCILHPRWFLKDDFSKICSICRKAGYEYDRNISGWSKEMSQQNYESLKRNAGSESLAEQAVRDEKKAEMDAIIATIVFQAGNSVSDAQFGRVGYLGGTHAPW